MMILLMLAIISLMSSMGMGLQEFIKSLTPAYPSRVCDPTCDRPWLQWITLEEKDFLIHCSGGPIFLKVSVPSNR